ncbi:MAG: ABC-type transport auxiliary lipoprotein family protein [Desulfovibrionales bacterium]
MKSFFLAALFLLLLSPLGCTSLKHPPPDIRYYTFEYASPDLTGTPLPCILEVSPFTIARSFDSTQIVYENGTYTSQMYFYHRWRANPGLLVSDFLLRDLQAVGLFKSIVDGRSGINASHVLEGRINRIMEKDTKEGWFGILDLTITLVRSNDNGESSRVVWQKTYSGKQILERKNPRGLAEALSRILSNISRELILDVHQSLKDEHCAMTAEADSTIKAWP